MLERKIIRHNWEDSNHGIIKKLSIDDIWQVWEELFFEALNDFYPVVYFPHKTGPDKWYDIVVNDIKIEIKTSTISQNGAFQHENIDIDRNFDAIAFIDITPDEFFLILAWKKDILWDNLHLRPNWLYKCDFTTNMIYKTWICRFNNYSIGAINNTEDIKDVFNHFLMLR